MNLIKLFYPKNSLKRKILDIKDDIKKIISPICNEKFDVIWYGAYNIDPKNLVYWICVRSDTMKFKFKADSALMVQLRQLLYKHHYPVSAIDSVFIGFESQETVDRESQGNWFDHFK